LCARAAVVDDEVTSTTGGPVLVLDTDLLPRQERAAAFQDTISGHASSSLVDFEDQPDFHARVHFFSFGAGRVFNVEARGNALRRTSRIARRDEQQAIALALPLGGANRFRWAREEALVRPHDLLLVDLDAPYEYGWSGSGTSYAFQVDRDRLGLGMDTIARATTRLPSSPLYGLVRDHVRSLTTRAHRLARSDAAAQLGDVTIELMHALVLSAAHADGTRPPTGPAVLVHAVQGYVRRHLSEHDLTPTRIAGAHHVSVRQLYLACEREGVALEPWIIAQRLERARSELATAAGRQRTIAAVAHAWGFASASHFTRRFRGAYGLTPREWRDAEVTAPGTDP
jgi:AraC-like DNA-binding protein